jgi:hypothetical protein
VAKDEYEALIETPSTCTYFTLEGMYKNGQFYGVCTQTRICCGLTGDGDTDTLSGVQLNGHFVGICKHTLSDGTVIEGERKNGRFTGECKFSLLQ